MWVYETLVLGYKATCLRNTIKAKVNMKKKCRFAECTKKASSAFGLNINGEYIPLCSEHGQYTAMRMMGVPVEELRARKKRKASRNIVVNKRGVQVIPLQQDKSVEGMK